MSEVFAVADNSDCAEPQSVRKEPRVLIFSVLCSRYDFSEHVGDAYGITPEVIFGPPARRSSLAPQAAAHSSKFACRASCLSAYQFQVLPVFRCNTPVIHAHCILNIPHYGRVQRYSCFPVTVNSKTTVFAAQHRVVNQQLAALAQRLQRIAVETVKPSK